MSARRSILGPALCLPLLAASGCYGSSSYGKSPNYAFFDVDGSGVPGYLTGYGTFRYTFEYDGRTEIREGKIARSIPLDGDVLRAHLEVTFYGCRRASADGELRFSAYDKSKTLALKLVEHPVSECGPDYKETVHIKKTGAAPGAVIEKKSGLRCTAECDLTVLPWSEIELAAETSGASLFVDFTITEQPLRGNDQSQGGDAQPLGDGALPAVVTAPVHKMIVRGPTQLGARIEYERCDPLGRCEQHPVLPAGALSGAWADGSGGLWTVGQGGEVWLGRGSDWTRRSPGPAVALSGVWGSSPSDVWAVGDQGTIVRWDGSRWTSYASGVTGALRAVSGCRAGDVWAVGKSGAGTGVVLRWDGAAWRTSYTGGDLYGVYCAATSDVWAVGASALLHWDGTSFTDCGGSALRTTFTAVHGAGPQAVWAVGSDAFNGVVYQWDGSAWKLRATRSGRASGVFALGPGNVWVTGERLLLHWNGFGWDDGSSDSTFTTVAGAAPDRFFFPRTDGFITRYQQP